MALSGMVVVSVMVSSGTEFEHRRRFGERPSYFSVARPGVSSKCNGRVHVIPSRSLQLIRRLRRAVLRRLEQHRLQVEIPLHPPQDVVADHALIAKAIRRRARHRSWPRGACGTPWPRRSARPPSMPASLAWSSSSWPCCSRSRAAQRWTRRRYVASRYRAVGAIHAVARGLLLQPSESGLRHHPSRMGLLGAAVDLGQAPPADQRRQGGTLQHQRRQDHDEGEEDDEPPRRKRIPGSRHHRHRQGDHQGITTAHPGPAEERGLTPAGRSPRLACPGETTGSATRQQPCRRFARRSRSP